MKKISTPEAPQAAGHYSQAIVHGGVVYVAGQLALDPARPGFVPPEIEAQTERALANVAAILKAAESSLGQVLQMTVFITDVELWSAVNGVYARVMEDHRPARAIIPCGTLKNGCLIEIQAIAAVDS